MSGTHNVYVVELDKDVLKSKKVQKLNPALDPAKTPLYVGMTGLLPQDRFNKHKEGLKANKWVSQFGLKLRPDLYEKFNPMKFEDAEKKEEWLAKKLRGEGFPVLGGNPQLASRRIKTASFFNKDFIGNDVEQAWAKFSGGLSTKGTPADMLGKDILLPNDKQLPAFQVKATDHFLNKHLYQSTVAKTRGGDFVPIAVGEPAPYTPITRLPEWDKAKSSLVQHGAWANPFSINNPDSIIKRVHNFRDWLGNTSKNELASFLNYLKLLDQRYGLKERTNSVFNEFGASSHPPVIQSLSRLSVFNQPTWIKKGDWAAYDKKRDEGLPPQQQRVVDRMKDPKTNGLLLFHGMGSGKTRASIESYRALKMPTDVIVPAALKDNYRKELKKWTGNSDPSNLKLVSQQRFSNSRLNTPIYDKGLQIVDEAQKAKNSQSELYQRLAATHPAKRMLLSGTPMLNDPTELANLVNLAAGKEVLPNNLNDFKNQYFKREKVSPGWLGSLTGVTPGTKYVLQNKKPLKKILDKYVDYYKPSQEGYPSVTEQDVNVPMSKNQQDLYNSILGKASWLTRYKVKHNIPPGRGEFSSMRAFLNGPRQVSNSTSGFVNDPKMVENPKINVAYQFLQQKMKEDPSYKAIVYSSFLNNGIRPYEELLKKDNVPYGEFSGAIPAKQRDEYVRQYNEGKLKALLVSGAGAEGLDTKNTRLEQLLEPYWNLAKERQVIGRGVRFHSHDTLPPEKQNVLVQRYFAKPKPTLLDRMTFNSSPTGTDQYIHNIAKQKDQMNQEVVNLIAPRTEGSAWWSNFE